MTVVDKQQGRVSTHGNHLRILNNHVRYIMAEKKEENYIETNDERDRGHVDTRRHNFECEKPDKHLGCDPGIDVAG